MHATSRRLPLVAATVAATVLALAAAATLAPAPASALEPVTDRTVTGPDGSAFGSTVSQEHCDVNGDGVADLAVGTYSTFDFTPGATAGYVLLGAGEAAGDAAVESTDAVRIIDTARTQMGGVDVRCAGDVDADGVDDLVVVSQNAAVFLVLGSPEFAEVTLDALGERGRVVTGPATRAIGVGDIDGDGRDEVGVTATTGEVTILDAETLAAQTPLAETTGPRVRGTGIDLVSTAAAGDVDGDGVDDLYVGSASWTVPDAAGRGTGAGWVLTDLRSTVEVGAGTVPGFRIEGPRRGYDLMGGSAVGIGDIDGDGLDDLLLGGDSDAPKTGSALVVLGSAAPSTVVTDPDAINTPSVSSIDGSGATVSRGWWINGLAADDHLGHAVGAARMEGWSMLLVGAMDGAPDATIPGSGYALALDSRALVDGSLPVSASGVLDARDLAGGAHEGGTIIAGHGAGVHLGRSFADLTADPAGDTVTFAVGAPTLFAWDGTLPAVRIVTLRATSPVTPEPTATETPVPTGEPTTSATATATVDPSTTPTDGAGTSTPATTVPMPGADGGALASTGADGVFPVTLAAVALALAGLVILALRRRTRDAG